MLQASFRFGHLVGAMGCAAWLFAQTAAARPDPLSTLTVTVESHAVRLVLVTPADALAAWAPPAAWQSAADYAAAAARRLRDESADLFELRLNYNVVSPSDARTAADGAQVRLEIEYPPPEGEPVRSLQVFSNLVTKLSSNHQQVLTVQDARTMPAGVGHGAAPVVAMLTLTRERFTAFVELPEVTPPDMAPSTAPAPAARPGASVPASTFLTGVRQGIVQYVGLLLLVALALRCASFGESALVFVCFFVGRFVTHFVTAPDRVRAPARLVEVLIAAALVYVAGENVLRIVRGRRAHRWVFITSAACGLLFGLRRFGPSVAGSVAFELGLATTQAAVVAITLGLSAFLRPYGPVIEGRLTGALSALIALAGAVLLVSRVVSG